MLSWVNLFESLKLMTLPNGVACKLLFLAFWPLFFNLSNLFWLLSSILVVLYQTYLALFWNPSLNGKAPFSNAALTLFLLLYNFPALINVSFLDFILFIFVGSYSFKSFSCLNTSYCSFFASSSEVLP